MFDNVLLAQIITGKYAGEEVFIPRIGLIPSNYTVEFKRVQFPVKPCYAMSINKAQGQSLRCAGIKLEPTGVFSHGQLYVGLSRCGNNKNLYILAKDSQTKNIVYTQVL